jgi:hypothetical protein
MPSPWPHRARPAKPPVTHSHQPTAPRGGNGDNALTPARHLAHGAAIQYGLNRDSTPGAIMAEHKHGSMDIKRHEYNFNTFIRFVVWGAGISLGILVFLAVFNS